MADTHALLKGQIEVWTRSYLWVPGDTPNFRPALCSQIYGDGRALFWLSTLNSRPLFYVIRGDSQWACGDDNESPWPEIPANDVIERIDQIFVDLEDEFGRGLCSYSGAHLYLPRESRGCSCEECEDPTEAEWPMVDDEGGCSWWRMRWPAGFPTVPHPWSWRGNLLREDFRP